MYKTAIVLLAAGLLSFGANDKAGKAVYEQSCKSCHGPDGAGNASVAKMMKVEMHDLKSADVQALTDDAMKKIVMEGKGKMAAQKALSTTAAGDVVAYVRTLGK